MAGRIWPTNPTSLPVAKRHAPPEPTIFGTAPAMMKTCRRSFVSVSQARSRRQTSSAPDGRPDVLDPHGQHLPGDLVAVLGIGGLGPLGVQFAVKMGFKTVAIARRTDKELLAWKLGAWRYIDSQAQYPAEELITLGGARVILATATSRKAFAAVLGGLGVDGK